MTSPDPWMDRLVERVGGDPNHDGGEWVIANAVEEIDRLRAAISSLVEFHGIAGHGRYVVLCDDLSVIAVDELMDGDNVVLDRGEAR